MKQKLVRFLQFIIFLGLGIWIFWFLYKDFDFSRLKKYLEEVDYFWVLMSIVVTLLSYMSRARRWILMIEPLGVKPSFRFSFIAIMIGYLMNLVVPRMGEVARCGVLSRVSKISFTSLIGTLITERFIDLITLLLLTASVVLSQFGHIRKFMDNNPSIYETIINIITSPWLWGLFFIAIILLIVWWLKVRKTEFFDKVKNFFRNFIKGLQTVLNMKRKWEFLFHTLFIWGMYFLMMYLMFFAFDFTSQLPVGAAFMAFIMGSYGMLAPVNGGIGTWHFMVIQSLLVFGASALDGEVFALVAHFVSTAFVIVVGLISLVILPLVTKKMLPKPE